jgi:hypothetical protein
LEVPAVWVGPAGLAALEVPAAWVGPAELAVSAGQVDPAG